ncbi:hypothetical protein AB1M95_02495 [Sulfitobacter sp. LCG007]
MRITNPHLVKAPLDAELIAIRRLLSEEPVSPKAPRRRTGADPERMRALASKVADVMAQRERTPEAASTRMPPEGPARNAASAAQAALEVADQLSLAMPDVRGSRQLNPAHRGISTEPPAEERPSLAPRIMCAALIVVALMHPLPAAILLGAAIVCMASILLALGSRRVWGAVLGRIDRIAQRRPARAAAMRHRLDALAMRWDEVLDRFPERWVEGLYMPDFAHIVSADARHQADPRSRQGRLRGGALA